MSIRDLTVRKFRTEDAKAVANIINSNLEADDKEAISNKAVLALSNMKKMYVALADGAVIGTASIDHDTISNVFADKDLRNKGAAEALTKHLEEIAANHGIHLIKLEANAEAQKLYERLDYSAVGQPLETELGTVILMEKYLT